MPTVTGRATDFITFSRPGATGGGATVTDSDGRIKWAGHNLLTNSESFDASAWQKDQSGSTLPAVTANNAAAPNSTTTADKVDFGAIDAAGDYSFVYQAFTALDATYTFGIWVKAVAAGDVGKKLWLKMWNTAAVGQIAVTLTADWQYVSTSGALTAGSSRRVDIATIGSTQGGENQDAVSVLLWGAHLYRSDLGSMVLNPARGDAYYPTTPRNALGFTEDYSNAAWPNLNLSVTTNSAVAPNGLQTADAIFETATTGRHRFRQAISVAPASSTVSVYAKANGRNFISINIDDGNTQYAVFNLATGAVGVTGGGAVAHTPVSAGDGWWRCAVTFTSLSTNGPFIHLRDTNSQPADYAGDVTKGVYLWGAQLSDSASLDAYSPVYGAAVTSAAYYAPRLDFDPVTLAARGLLVEELRVNLAWHSADYTQSYWTKVNASIDATAVVAPDGVSRTTLRVKDDATNASHAIRRSFSTTNGLTYTLSFWVKKGTTDTFAAVVYADGVYFATLSVSSIDNNTQSVTGATGVNPTASRVSYPSGWYRYSFTFTATSASAPDINFHPRNLTGAYVGTGDYTDFYGIQLEQGSFATSYIPTGASTATRTADVASVSTQAFPYSATEGTIVVSGLRTALYSADPVAVALFTNSSNTIEMYTKNSDNRLYAAVGGVQQVGFLDANKIVAGTPFKGAVAYKLNDYAMATNGGTVLTDTTATVPVATTLGIGSRGGSLPFVGYIRQITYIPRRLSNAELQSRSV